MLSRDSFLLKLKLTPVSPLFALIYTKTAKIGEILTKKEFSGNAQIKMFVNKVKMARNKDKIKKGYNK